MSASSNSLAAPLESDSLKTESAAVRRAYCLISQLRRHPAEQSPLSTETAHPLDWRQREHEVRPVRAAGF